MAEMSAPLFRRPKLAGMLARDAPHIQITSAQEVRRGMTHLNLQQRKISKMLEVLASKSMPQDILLPR